MRVRVIFNLRNKGATVPYHHQALLAQIIKGILVKGGDQCLKDYRVFNFSGLKGQTRIGNTGLHFFSKKITVVLSSPNKGFLDYLLRNLFTLSSLEVGNLVLVPDSVDQELIPEFNCRSKFICISPLVLLEPAFESDQGKEFIPPDSEDFGEKLLESIEKRIANMEGPENQPSTEGFEFEPDLDYLAKIRVGQKKFSRIYSLYDDDVRYEVRGYTFPFTLEGNPELFRFLFNCGIGEYTHKGFGMLDIGAPGYERRIEPYEFE